MSPLTEYTADLIVPLSQEEEDIAVGAARTLHRGENIEVRGAELRIEKLPRDQPQRHVAVFLVDLSNYRVHEVVVDPAGEVVAERELSDYVLPFSADEVGRVKAMVLTHPAVGELARRDGVETAVYYPTAHGHGQRGEPGRPIGVHLLDTTDPSNIVPLASVVVDLLVGEVTFIEEYQ